MRASRALSSPFLKSMKFPDRSGWDMLMSATQGVMSILSSKQSPTKFLNYIEKGLIKDDVLLQSNFGLFRMLSLYNDMENPLFQKHKVNLNEFLEDVGPALENFHDCLGSLQNKFNEIEKQAKIKKQEKASKASDPKGDEEDGLLSKLSAEHSSLREESEQILSLLQQTSGLESTIEDHPVWNYSWNKEAEKDPDSDAGQLALMCTREFFDILQMSSKAGFFLNKNVLFKEGTSKVNNVALLSARAVEMDELENMIGDDEAEAEAEPEDTKDSKESQASNGEPAVAAQVEVLYDVTQTFLAKNIKMTDDQDIADADGQDKDDDGKMNEELATNVVVGVFEGWLNGGPGGELRWRLQLSRRPTEFPSS